MSNLLIAASYTFPHEAQLAKSSLEAAGISAQLADEHTINMQWLYSNALGGVKVLVAAENLEQAQELLATDFSANLVEKMDTASETCPACRSTSVKPYIRGKKPAFVVFLLLGFPLFLYQHGMKCESCGNFWKS